MSFFQMSAFAYGGDKTIRNHITDIPHNTRSSKQTVQFHSSLVRSGSSLSASDSYFVYARHGGPPVMLLRFAGITESCSDCTGVRSSGNEILKCKECSAVRDESEAPVGHPSKNVVKCIVG